MPSIFQVPDKYPQPAIPPKLKFFGVDAAVSVSYKVIVAFHFSFFFVWDWFA